MKLKHIALIGSLFPILFSLVLFFGVLISADSDDENSNFSSGITGMNLSAEVLKHQPMVEKYAREYGISEYVNVLLAIIQVESGGTAEDVMQSSESLGLPPNSLDTESSIKQGCKYFASLLSSCKNQGIDDLNVAIQSYNYGGGYVGYVAGKGKKHTFNLAESFAREKSGGKKVTYTNPIAVAKNGGWRYGYEPKTPEADASVDADTVNDATAFLETFFKLYPTATEKELAYYVSGNVLEPIGRDYLYSELVNPIFTKDGDNVKVKVAVKFLDNQTKATQVSQYELVLQKDSNWKIVG